MYKWIVAQCLNSRGKSTTSYVYGEFDFWKLDII